jgi:dynamin 1-like protein
MKSGGAGTMTDRERVETEIIKTLLSSYFDIVKKNFLDLVPKTIMHFLVNAFKESLQNELVKELYKEEIMHDLMKETADVASRRKACREMKELLRKGLEIVNEVRDFTFM